MNQAAIAAHFAFLYVNAFGESSFSLPDVNAAQSAYAREKGCVKICFIILMAYRAV